MFSKCHITASLAGGCGSAIAQRSRTSKRFRSPPLRLLLVRKVKTFVHVGDSGA